MTREPLDEKIVDIIYKLILKRPLVESENATLEKWMGSSLYYRNLLNDIESDRVLKDKLLRAYIDDKDEFWKIVVTYRAALP